MGLAKASLEARCATWPNRSGPKGMRVNGISAGPIKTLAASGIKDFGKILSVVAEASPIRRNVTIEDVGNVAAFLLCDLAGGVTRRDHLRRWRLQPRGGWDRRVTGCHCGLDPQSMAWRARMRLPGSRVRDDDSGVRSSRTQSAK